MIMTTSEVCKTTGVTRRALQGYEQMGLIKRCGTNKMGYLVFDEEAQERVKLIKFYQDIGIERKNIKGIMDAPIEERRVALKCCVERLEDEAVRISRMIQKLREHIASLDD